MNLKSFFGRSYQKENESLREALNEAEQKNQEVEAKAEDLKRRTRKQSAVIKLQRLTQYLYKIDIKNWRAAHNDALSVERPRRDRLMDVYDDAMLDTHLRSVVSKRILKILNTDFEVVNEEDELDEDATILIRKKWFFDYIRYIMESIFKGYSVTQLNIGPGKHLNTEVLSVDTIPRRHVVPDHFSVLPDIYADEEIDITQPPYNHIYSFIGDPEDMGILLECCVFTIFKKHAVGHWSRYEELYGVPYRSVKTDTKDGTELNLIENHLKNMGSSAYGMFPTGSELEIKEVTNTDAYNVFLEGIKMADEQVSKRILGQTMTTDNGSSRSQSEVHERVEDEITKADLRKVEFEINDNLIPKLIGWGYPLENKRFRFNRGGKLKLADSQLSIDQFLAQHFELDAEDMEQKYGTKIIGSKQQTTPTPSEEGK